MEDRFCHGIKIQKGNATFYYTIQTEFTSQNSEREKSQNCEIVIITFFAVLS